MCVVHFNPHSRNGGAQEILTGWNLQFDKSLIEFSGRVLPTEKIHQKGRSVRSVKYKCEYCGICTLSLCVVVPVVQL